MTAPERIYHVSRGQLSVSRHFGGCSFQGQRYHYDENSDSLVRIDVWLQQIKKAAKIAEDYAKQEREKWQDAQGGFSF